MARRLKYKASFFFVSPNIIVLLLFLISLSACDREDPKPYLKDPIYNDIQAELRNAEDALKKLEDKIYKDRKDLEKIPIRTIDRAVAIKELQKDEKLRDSAAQELEYYRVAEVKRRVESTINYKRARQNKEAWPDPKEYEAYKVQKRLREKSNASKNANFQ